MSVCPTCQGPIYRAVVPIAGLQVLKCKQCNAVSFEGDSEWVKLSVGWQDRLKAVALSIRRRMAEVKRREECEASARSDDLDPRWGPASEVLPYSGLNPDWPAWFNPAAAQADYNATKTPEPEYRVVDMFRGVDEFRKSQSG